jgi:hypothetical protein
VVLEVPPHAREIDDGLDAELLEASLWTDAPDSKRSAAYGSPPIILHVSG